MLTAIIIGIMRQRVHQVVQEPQHNQQTVSLVVPEYQHNHQIVSLVAPEPLHVKQVHRHQTVRQARQVVEIAVAEVIVEAAVQGEVAVIVAEEVPEVAVVIAAAAVPEVVAEEAEAEEVDGN